MRIHFVFLLIALGATAQVQLTDNGQPLGVIIHNGHTELAPELQGARDSRHILPPAEELQAYLQTITGAVLPVVATAAEAAGKPAIVLELVDRVPGASDRATGDQAYRIATDGNRLTLTAASPLGLHLAVYGLLEDHLDCRFYSFRRKGLGYDGPGFEVVPGQPSLTLTAIDDLQEPAFANRGIIFWMGSYPWILKNRGIGYPSGQTSGALAAGHNMYHIIPPKDARTNVVGEDGKVSQATLPGLFQTHPEFYPMNKDGKREPTWAMGICGTAKDLPAFIAQGVIRDIKVRQARSKGEIDWSMPFSVAQGDGFSGCMCDDCRQLVHQEQSESAPLILALNGALDIVTTSYPQAKVITFAYFGTIDAPKTLKPHPNLWINVVSSDAGGNAAGDQMGLIAGNPANADYARALADWPRIAPGRVTVWHWDTYRAEWPSMFYVDDNMRTFQESGLYGVNPQFCGGPWVDMLAWLYLKLAWNPQLDGDALIRQYCTDNYGPEAGAHVYAYLELARSGYEDTLYLPSAVRWSGWTPTMRVKMFHPALLEKMIAAMDQAQAAAEKSGNAAWLDNLIGARGQSLDVVMLNEVSYSGKPWGSVRYEGDGKQWYVPGGDARVPAALMRAKQGIVADGGGEAGVLRTITSYVGNNGGPLFTLAADPIAASICPDLKGQLTSATWQGTELLAASGATGGYTDLFGRVSAQIWLPPSQIENLARRANDDWSRLWSDYEHTTPQALETLVVLSPSHYGFHPNQYVRRNVTTSGDGVTITRQFVQEKAARGMLKNPSPFTTRWRFAMPDSRVAKVAIRGGGIDQLLDLSYAVPGGITTRKAGEKMKGADWMDERFDTVIAVSAAEATKLPIAADDGGNLTLTFDRGDGTAAELTTGTAGWAAVEVKPIVESNVLEVTLVGTPIAMDGEPKTVELPTQTLSARKVAKAKAPPADAAAAAAPVAPRIRQTSETTAINEIDGAELIWIPAGSFIRGSDHSADEQPRQEVQLDGYWVYKYPVTVAQYQAFCEATGSEFTRNWGQDMHAGEPGDDGAYAVQTNWYEADAYAKWAGAALPTEAQWEKAARGAEGWDFPWGNDWDAAKSVSYAMTVNSFSPGFMPVTSEQQSVSPYGIVATAGNVWEWVADWYQHDYFQTAPTANPPGPEAGSHKVIRGGSSLYDYRFSRTSARMIQPPQVRDWTPIGFRCVINRKPEAE